MLSKLVVFTLSLCFGLSSAIGSTEGRISSFFERFDTNPTQTMNELPAKYNSRGQLLLNLPVKTSIATKLKVRNQMTNPRVQRPFAGVNYKNNLTTMLENSKLLNLLSLSEQAGSTAQLPEQPWSGDYFATYRGGLAARFAEQGFPSSSRWRDYDSHFSRYLSEDYSARPQLDELSAAEKYDLLVGDTNKTLTRWSIQQSASSVNPQGQIETWFGLCHGWAPAAYMDKRPRKTVSIRLESGQELKFFPDDIKGLSTLLWSNARFGQLFVGGRCNDKNPKQDENGRILFDDCWDTNPAVWHAAVLNRVGVDKVSFVMDATFDYEVWNQPVTAFKVQYFNPETRKEGRLQDSTIALSSFSKDRFKKYRSPKAISVVGVMMSVEYVSEISASHKLTDSSADDSTVWVDYFYDLELDAQGNLVGGEWYQNAHPDFLWSPTKGSKAKAFSEQGLPAWDGQSALSARVKQVAAFESANGIPLRLIVEALTELAQ